MTDDIFGAALSAYNNGSHAAELVSYLSSPATKEAVKEVLPVQYLFRNYDKMPALEQKALQLCRGTVLDIGCGAGSHSLYLQQAGFDVTALDKSKGATETCLSRGIRRVHNSDLFSYSGTKFDTLLLLMNGLGIVGRLANMDRFLHTLKSLLKPGGQILMDSSDIIYIYEEEDGGYWVPEGVSYYGEVLFTLEFMGKQGAAFPWLYLDFNTLQRAAMANNFKCELVSRGKHFDYLARLSYKG